MGWISKTNASFNKTGLVLIEMILNLLIPQTGFNFFFSQNYQHIITPFQGKPISNTS